MSTRVKSRSHGISLTTATICIVFVLLSLLSFMTYNSNEIDLQPSLNLLRCKNKLSRMSFTT